MTTGVLERVTSGLARVDLRRRGGAAERPTGRPTGPTATTDGRPGRDWWLLAGFVVLAQLSVVVDLGVPVLRPLLGIAVLLAVPTWLLAPLLGWVPERNRTLTALGLVVLGTILGAGALNVVLPLLGVDEPLRAPYLALASTVVDLSLMWVRRRQAEGWLLELTALARGARTARVHAALLLACTGVVLAVLGAVRLNNGAGTAVTMVALACLSLALLALIVQRDTSLRVDGATIYVVGVGLLLATSLRGWFVQGHDVQLEYVSYLLTESAGRWSISQFPSPYHACLSINIWPVVVSAFSGVSGAYVFKLVLQLLYALIPVQAYLWFRQLLPRPMAVLAAILLVAFPTFTADLPYLVRQEGAFYFLTLALLVAHPRTFGDAGVLRRTRALVGVFLLGVMFSHYSTTYTVLMVLFLGCVLLHGERLWRRRSGREVERRPLVLLWWPMIAALVVSTWIWVNPVTGTGGHAGDVLRDTISSLVGGGEDTTASSDLRFVPILGDGPTPQERLDDYSTQVQQELGTSGLADQSLGLTDPAVVSPRIDQPEASPLTPLGSALASLGLDVTGANAALRTIFALALQLALLVGAVVVVRGSRLTRAYDRERVWLTVGCIGALGAFAVAPGLSVDYGVLRVFYQGLLIFAPAVVLGLITLAQPLGRWRTPVVAGVVVATLATLGGFVPALVGGDDRPRPAFSQSGPYSQLYSLSPQEVAGAEWLREVGAPGDGTSPDLETGPYAQDRDSAAAASRKNSAYTYPSQVLRDQYVYLGRSVVQQQRSSVFYSGDLLFYRYPLAELEASKDLVYSNPSSVVLR